MEKNVSWINTAQNAGEWGEGPATVERLSAWKSSPAEGQTVFSLPTGKYFDQTARSMWRGPLLGFVLELLGRFRPCSAEWTCRNTQTSGDEQCVEWLHRRLFVSLNNSDLGKFSCGCSDSPKTNILPLDAVIIFLYLDVLCRTTTSRGQPCL